MVDDDRPLPDHAALERTAELFKALGHPTRLAILLLLLHRPSPVSQLAATLDLPQPLVSQHLRVLRAAHSVHADRDGRQVLYALADEHVRHVLADALNHADEPPHPDRD